MGANLGILGQMMMAMNPEIKPWSEIEQSHNEAERGRLANQTALIGLANQKRQQEAEAIAMQFAQAHPESILGNLSQAPGGPPGMPPAGGMTQQSFAPGMPTQAPQGVPGGQDQGRFAGVSPQSGGPMPQSMINQLTPQVTPPQSVIGGLGGQQPQPGAQQNPLVDLMRQNPQAAMIAQQRLQQLQTQQIDWQGKKMSYFGRILQGVNSPESYADAVHEIARIDPQEAARLPPTYSKEAIAPYITRAADVVKNAELRLETMRVQAEMARAGLAGQPAEVTTELRAMGVSPMGATPEQLQKAQQNIQDRAIKLKQQEGAAAADIRTQADVAARQNQTLAEAFKGETTNLYDTNTLQPLDARMKVKDYEALPAGQVKQFSSDVRKQVEQLNSAVPIITQLQTHIDKIYGPGGALARMTSDERADLAAAPGRWAQQYAQKYPELIQAQRFIDANAGALARALAGETGAMNEGDIERAKAMLPSLSTSLKVWPPSQLAIQAPDTRAVALGTMNSLVDMINARGQTLSGNEKYQHPKLHRYQTAEEEQRATGGPVTPPKVAPPELPIPPLVKPNPLLSPPGPGESYGPIPREDDTPPTRPPAAPSTRPTPPAATSTPAQDEAYRQSQGQGRPAAPAPPAARPTPGRQSQAPPAARPTRVALAGAPKYMELADVAEAMRQTGRSRREVEAAARSKGYTVYGSKLKLPEETAIG